MNQLDAKKDKIASPKHLVRVDLEAVAEIFNPNHNGGMYLKNVVNEQFLTALRKDVSYLSDPKFGEYGKFVKPKKQEVRFTDKQSGEKQDAARQNTVTNSQDLYYFYIGPGRNPFSELENLPAIKELAEEYTYKFYNPLARITRLFAERAELIDSIAINKYDPVIGHIGWHQDDDYNRDIVTAIHISGRASFATARSIMGNDETRYEVGPGDICLLRAPSVWATPSQYINWEQRPWHMVETGYEPKITLLFRHVDLDLRAKAEAEDAKRKAELALRNSEKLSESVFPM